RLDDIVGLGLYVVRRDGTGLHRVTNRCHDSFAWSPDSRKLVYNRTMLAPPPFEPDIGSVCTVDADGRHHVRILDDREGLSWSGDGARIAVDAIAGGLGVKDSVSSSGGDERRIADARWGTYSPTTGDFLYWGNKDEGVIVRRADGSDRVVDAGGGEGLWAPDG